MSDNLEWAIQAAAARKLSVLPTSDEDGITFNFTTEDQGRAIFSGFDIDYDDLRLLAERAGRLFATMSLDLNLSHTHEAAWTEGLLVGLLVSECPKSNDTGCGRCIYCQHGQRCPWPDGPPGSDGD